MSDRWTSHEPIAIQGHNNDACLMISPRPIATKGHSCRIAWLIPPRSQKVRLANINICLQQYLRVASTVTWEINFIYPLTLSFFRVNYDWTCLPLSNIAYEQPRLYVCPTSLTKIGRIHNKKFHTNFDVVQHRREISPSPARVPRCCWMVLYHNRTRCISWIFLIGEGHFLYDLFFNVYITLILSSNVSGDISSHSLLLSITAIVIPGVSWHHFLPSKFGG
jgi:hypothetical protein